MRILVNKFLLWQFFDALLFLSKSLLIYVGIFLFFSLNMEKYKIHFFRKLMPTQDTTKSKLTLKKICSFLCSSLVQILFFSSNIFPMEGIQKSPQKSLIGPCFFADPFFGSHLCLTSTPLVACCPKALCSLGLLFFCFQKSFRIF